MPRKCALALSRAGGSPARGVFLLVLALAAAQPPHLKAQASATYPVGEAPVGIAFDGVNIWVTNSGDNSVSELLASTGATIGTYPVGSIPYAVAFDGANIWVANLGSNNVTKLLASTGVLVGTYPVGLSPRDVAYDGSNIWVPNVLSGLTKLLAST